MTFAAGESLFEQGDPSDVVYVIDEGEIDIVRDPRRRERGAARPIGPGQYFGELGPLLGFPRSASARAATDVTLIAYSVRTFRERVLRN